jgi:hypothetical protein
MKFSMKLLSSLLLGGLTIAVSQPAQAEMITVNVNRVCAAIVDIPYASDNFSDEEWENFKSCRDYLQRFNGVE